MPTCEECDEEYTLDDGSDEDGMCHDCAHAVAEGRISAMVSARDLTVLDLKEELRRCRRLLDCAASTLDRHMPDGAGARAVLTGKMRDAVVGKYDEGEWEDDTGYRRLSSSTG